MPNCDFYAAENDLFEVLDLLFAQTKCRVYEMYSPFGEELTEFTSTREVANKFAVGKCKGNSPSVLLQIFPEGAGGSVKIEKINLIPEKCDGHTFRFRSSGWGLIQLYLGGIGPSGLVHSHTNHNSEKRALAWETNCPELGPVADWDWKAITLFSSRFNSVVKKRLAVSKIGSRPVLRQAAEIINTGVELV